MPPKRKRADTVTAHDGASQETATTTTTRATRASTKSAAAATAKKPTATKAATSRNAKKAAAQAVDDDGGDSDAESPPPAPKKAKPTKAKEPAEGTRKPATAKASSSSKTAAAATKKTMGANSSQQSIVSAPKANGKDALGPYDPSRAQALYNQYAETGDGIGAEGFEQLCAAAELDMAGAAPLLFAWAFKCTSMASISKDEWRAGSAALKVDTPAKLRVVVADLDRHLFNPNAHVSAKAVYARDGLPQLAQSRDEAFGAFYGFCFNLVKGTGRSIDAEYATGLWGVLLVPRYPVAASFVEFVQEKGWKGVTKDLWSMLLEFCQTIDPSLSNFEADGAWPSAIDEFVVWKKEKLQAEAA